MVVEFSDLKYKLSSNFTSIGWKLRILETWPMLTFWSTLSSKLIDAWVQRPQMQMVFKFQVNWMKIEDFRKFMPNLSFWPMLISTLIGVWIQRPNMHMIFKFQVNRMKIVNFRKNYKIGPILSWPYGLMTLPIIGGWIQWPDMQILFQFQINWMKFEDFRKFGSNWPVGQCRPFRLTEISETSKFQNEYGGKRWMGQAVQNKPSKTKRHKEGGWNT